MSDMQDFFQNGKWYHCFRHDGMVSNGTYDIEKYISHYKFDIDYKGRTVLDVGCSDGYFSLWMKEHNADKVCAVDSNKYDGSVAIDTAAFDKNLYEQKYSQYALDYNKFSTIYQQFGLGNSNKLLFMSALKKLDVQYYNGTVYDLKPYGAFDVVLCNDLLEHLRDPITAIEQLYNSLATNGKCVLTTIQVPWKERILARRKPILHYQGHVASGGYYKFTEASLIAMCKAAGFKKVEVVSRFNMLNQAHKTNIPLFVVHAYK